MLGLPEHIKNITDIIRANSNLKKYAKHVNAKRFEQFGFVVFSQPQIHPDITIYGLFLFDKENAKKNLSNSSKSKSEIVQDFIAYDRNTDSIIYYSGRGKKTGEHQTIRNFCNKFGKGPDGNWTEYGCSDNGTTTNHRYKDENDVLLPSEKWIRREIKIKAEAFRESLKQSPSPSIHNTQGI